jgi:ATP-binding cassette subfamily C protein/ATP-binding cassette subfamily C protein CydC/ATP-binding cassette subfamily C protein CydCD
MAAELATLGLTGTAGWLIARAAQQPPIAAVSLAIVMVRVLAVTRGPCRYIERLASHDVAFRALASLRARVYAALIPLAPSGAPAYRSADLLSRMVSDVEAVQDLVVRVLVPVSTAVVVAGITAGFAAVVLPSAGIALTVGLILAGVVTPLLVLTVVGWAAGRLAPLRAELAARTTDLLYGSAELAVFGGMDTEAAKANSASVRLTRLERKLALVSGGGSALAMLVQGATTVAVTAISVRAASNGDVAAVMVPVLALTALLVFEPALLLIPAALRFVESQASMRRVLAILQARAPVPEPAHPLPRPHGDITVDLQDLQVRYPGARRHAIDCVDLRLEPGRRVAIVGASGSGKSTLLACLMRFVDPSAGTVLLNGQAVRDYAGDDVRAVITGLTQDAHLFHTSIRENLLIARPSAGEDELFAVLERVRLQTWVKSLRHGLDTMVGETGGQISGGQRQRLLLARVLLADPHVVLLDEPTEGLDSRASDELLADLLAPHPTRVTVVVTHRLSCLDAVDEIVVLDAGRIIQRGTHHSLMTVPGRYRDLWWAYTGGDLRQRREG